MELNERLDKELERRFEDLENLKTGSDEQGKATDNIVKLYKLRMDENEQENSKNADEDKAVLERHKLELEEQKAKDDKLIRILTTVTSVGVTIAGFAVGSHWYGKGFKFEETGTICSSTFKGLMRDFRFFKK
ncbi:hypothetical protein RX411_02005 [Faecalibacterium prausnitzii]|jgi:hypothetical protein|uniref:hypothetical protein n=1 Tax=Faecalibacterium prausnitzii TaxID=853 RepID=UPI002907D46C|nr:hypothetical protein [Faecalibacterium prausnitzii]